MSKEPIGSPAQVYDHDNQLVYWVRDWKAGPNLFSDPPADHGGGGYGF
ncbi:MAG: hypothetical protein LUE26_11390 [Alistipes sp.]|nr:hypothetical protein [Alistipes sp.]